MGPLGIIFSKMLSLHESNPSIKVIADQIGAPTDTNSLSLACWKRNKKSFQIILLLRLTHCIGVILE